jgi:cellulose synthase/poly-beta-1,6-N-acetylglucosamine synthase-like glycosyltransferase
VSQPRDSLDVDAADAESQRVARAEELLGPAACRALGIYALPADFRLSVVIPVFNEIATLAEVVRRVRACEVPCQIILVDDGSTDGSRELLERWRGQADLTVILHERNRGKGAALRTGFAAADGDAVIIQDAGIRPG